MRTASPARSMSIASRKDSAGRLSKPARPPAKLRSGPAILSCERSFRISVGSASSVRDWKENWPTCPVSSPTMPAPSVEGRMLPSSSSGPAPRLRTPNFEVRYSAPGPRTFRSSLDFTGRARSSTWRSRSRSSSPSRPSAATRKSRPATRPSKGPACALNRIASSLARPWPASSSMPPSPRCCSSRSKRTSRIRSSRGPLKRMRAPGRDTRSTTTGSRAGHSKSRSVSGPKSQLLAPSACRSSSRSRPSTSIRCTITGRRSRESASTSTVSRPMSSISSRLPHSALASRTPLAVSCSVRPARMETRPSMFSGRWRRSLAQRASGWLSPPRSWVSSATVAAPMSNRTATAAASRTRRNLIGARRESILQRWGGRWPAAAAGCRCRPNPAR